jgi:hypothetical protein
MLLTMVTLLAFCARIPSKFAFSTVNPATVTLLTGEPVLPIVKPLDNPVASTTVLLAPAQVTESGVFIATSSSSVTAAT